MYYCSFVTGIIAVNDPLQLRNSEMLSKASIMSFSDGETSSRHLSLLRNEDASVAIGYQIVLIITISM